MYYASIEIKPRIDSLIPAANLLAETDKLDLLMKKLGFWRQEGWIYSGLSAVYISPLIERIQARIKLDLGPLYEVEIRAVRLYELKEIPLVS